MRRPKWSLPVVALLAGVFLLPAIAFAAPETTEICHFNADNDPGVPDWELLEVNSNSVDSHLAHGDGFPGEPVPGTDGEYVFTGECVPELVELIFAVAYVDIANDGGAYDSDVDRLIAKVVDGPAPANDGVLGIGDQIHTSHYPTNFLPILALFGERTHPIPAGSTVIGNNTLCRIDPVDGSFFIFIDQSAHERYGEAAPAGQASNWVDGIDTSFFEFIGTNRNSPSRPDQEVFLFTSDQGDDPWFDVDLNCTP